MHQYHTNRGRDFTLASTLLAAAFAGSGTNPVDAQSIALDVDFSDVQTTSSRAPRDYDFGLDLLHGIRVRAHRVGVEPDWDDWIWLRPGAVPMPGAEDRTWVESFAGGYHETDGYSVHAYLTEEGEIAFNFQGFESAHIESFEIDLGWNFCFDRTAPNPGTSGSGEGRDISIDDTSRQGYAQSGDLDLNVIYRDPIQISGDSLQGDTFESIHILMANAFFRSTDAFGIVTDLDARFDDPGPRYAPDAAFDWNGHSWIPMYDSDPTILGNNALKMCGGDGPLGESLSIALPDGTCYFEMEIHDDWGCWLAEEAIDNSWYIKAAGDSGIPMGFTFDSYSGEPVCTRYFHLVGPASFSRIGPDAEWYVTLKNSFGGTLDLELPDDWYLQASPTFLVDGSFKSAGMGIVDNGDSLTLMNLEFEHPAFLEYWDLEGDWTGMTNATGVELRLRGEDQDEVLAAMGVLREGVVGVEQGCTGFGDIEIIECSGTSAPPQDLNGDGAVDGMDLAEVLASWGACEGCPADFNGDGVVNGGDFALILTAWTG